MMLLIVFRFIYSRDLFYVTENTDPDLPQCLEQSPDITSLN